MSGLETNQETLGPLPIGLKHKPSAGQQRLVVLGGGMSAHYLATRLVEQHGLQRFSLTIVSEEDEVPYDRVNLAAILEGASPQSLWLHPPSWYQKHNISIYLGHQVESVDIQKTTIRTHQGLTLPFDQLVFATGSAPFRPSIPGIDHPRVITYRTTNEAEQIARSIQPQSRVLVVGGGLLGLETSRVLARQRCSVEVIEAAPRLLPRQLDEEGASLLAAQIQKLNIGLRLHQRVSSIQAEAECLRVTLNDGTTCSYDLVIVATGTKPRDELAIQSGIVCDPKGGILVDDRLRTSDSRVWAIGECVRHRHKTYGFVSPCHDMASVLVSNLLKRRGTFRGTYPTARLKIDEVPMVTVGETTTNHEETHVVSWTAPDEYRRLVLHRNRVVGAIAIGPSPDFPQIQMAVATGKRPKKHHLHRFRNEGKLLPAQQTPNIKQWPNRAIVCSCTGITCGQLRSQLAQGASTPLLLSQKTGAATVCGSCKPLLETLTGTLSTQFPSRSSNYLTIIGIAALILLSIRAITGPIAMSTSIQEMAVDILWRKNEYKQVSGYILLAFCLGSLFLSLRKRIKKFNFGSIFFWRSLHAALGLSALTFTGIHTGFRLGENLNFALMASFILVIISGALISLLAPGERFLGSYSGRIRRLVTGAHILFFWPWPVLVFFHILSSYYY